MEDKNTKMQEGNVANDLVKEYKEERFEFALHINGNLVCKRNFRINNFIEGSVHSEDFKNAMDYVVSMIDEELKSKSRIYTWTYYNPEDPMDEFVTELPEPWEYTFMFTVTDNKKEVYSRIWDGSGYPAIVRNNVDLTNSVIKFVKKDGDVLSFDAEKYFEDNKGRLSPEAYVKKAMMNGKKNMLPMITKTICETCSPWNASPYEKISDYTTKLTFGKGKKSVTYDMLIERENRRLARAVDKSNSKK